MGCLQRTVVGAVAVLAAVAVVALVAVRPAPLLGAVAALAQLDQLGHVAAAGFELQLAGAHQPVVLVDLLVEPGHRLAHHREFPARGDLPGALGLGGQRRDGFVAELLAHFQVDARRQEAGRRSHPVARGHRPPTRRADRAGLAGLQRAGRHR